MVPLSILYHIINEKNIRFLCTKTKFMCEPTYYSSWVNNLQTSSKSQESNDITCIEIGTAVSKISAAKHANFSIL